MRLSSALSRRENNLTLVRFVAAFAVTVSHAFVLTSGKLADEPLRGLLGMSLGDVAVDVFFVVSGFLVVGSLLRKRDGVGFLVARARRILPALCAMVVACVLLLGPLAGELPVRSFFRSHATWSFAIHNLTLVRGVEFGLPGLFSHLPWPWIVNGSLWTLVYEVRLYLSLAAIWWIVRLFRGDDGLVKILCTAMLLAAGIWQVSVWVSTARDIHGLVDPVPRLVFMFYSGVCWRTWGERIPLDARLAALWVVCCVLAFFAGPFAFLPIYELGLPYAIWWASFAPQGGVLEFNRLGDASYGIYIYSFPIQQLLVQVGVTRPLSLIVVGGAIVVVLGFASWHLLEKRFLVRGRTAPAPSPHQVAHDLEAAPRQ